jgi:protein SSD1
LKLKSLGDHHALETTKSEALLQPENPSKQYTKSANRGVSHFDGMRKDVAGGHRVQDVKELMKVEVIVVSDVTKSPPVLVVYACKSYQS